MSLLPKDLLIDLEKDDGERVGEILNRPVPTSQDSQFVQWPGPTLLGMANQRAAFMQSQLLLQNLQYAQLGNQTLGNQTFGGLYGSHFY